MASVRKGSTSSVSLRPHLCWDGQTAPQHWSRTSRGSSGSTTCYWPSTAHPSRTCWHMVRQVHHGRQGEASAALSPHWWTFIPHPPPCCLSRATNIIKNSCTLVLTCSTCCPQVHQYPQTQEQFKVSVLFTEDVPVSKETMMLTVKTTKVWFTNPVPANSAETVIVDHCSG